MPWTLQQYEDLQKIIDTAIKKITKNGVQFPTDLLYAEHGLNFEDLTTTVQRAKMAVMARATSNQRGRGIINCLVARAFQYAGTVCQANTKHVLREQHWTDSTWLRSVIEWNARHGTVLETTGVRAQWWDLPPHEAARERGLVMSNSAKRRLIQLGVATAAEIPADFTELRELATPNATVQIRRGQCWTNEKFASSGEVFEIVRVDKDEVTCQRWRTVTKDEVRVGSSLFYTQDDSLVGADVNACGGARFTTSTFLAAFENGTLVTTEQETHGGKRGTPVNLCVVFAMEQRQLRKLRDPPTVETTTWPAGSVVYTDGSYARHGSILEWARGKPQVQAAAGIYVRTPGSEPDIRVRIPYGVKATSSFTTEAVALAAALSKAHSSSHIHTDSEACLKLLQAQPAKRTRTCAEADILRCSEDVHGRLHKVKSHAEKRKPQHEWTLDERGNIQADHTAAGKDAGGIIETWTGSQMRAILEREKICVWTHNDEILFDPRQLEKRRRIDRYTQRRDEFRALATPKRQPRWTMTTTALGRDMWRKAAARDIGTWARSVRILYEKHCDGENLIKWTGDSEDCVCKYCGRPTGIQHAILHCTKPEVLRLRNRARSDCLQQINAVRKRHSGLGDFINHIEEAVRSTEDTSIWTGA